jgi:uncharacterized coiled-coil protein SlyX
MTTLGERIKAKRDARVAEQVDARATAKDALTKHDEQLANHDQQLADLTARIELLEKGKPPKP